MPSRRSTPSPQPPRPSTPTAGADLHANRFDSLPPTVCPALLPGWGISQTSRHFLTAEQASPDQGRVKGRAARPKDRRRRPLRGAEPVGRSRVVEGPWTRRPRPTRLMQQCPLCQRLRKPPNRRGFSGGLLQLTPPPGGRRGCATRTTSRTHQRPDDNRSIVNPRSRSQSGPRCCQNRRPACRRLAELHRLR